MNTKKDKQIIIQSLIELKNNFGNNFGNYIDDNNLINNYNKLLSNTIDNTIKFINNDDNHNIFSNDININYDQLSKLNNK